MEPFHSQPRFVPEVVPWAYTCAARDEETTAMRAAGALQDHPLLQPAAQHTSWYLSQPTQGSYDPIKYTPVVPQGGALMPSPPAQPFVKTSFAPAAGLNFPPPPTPPPPPPGRDPVTRVFSPRRRLMGPPLVGHIYYLPDGRHFPESIIHTQKRDDAFFHHPVLVVGVDYNKAFFYALTKKPPHAIAELNMCLSVGSTYLDQGKSTLRLTPSSQQMPTSSYVNLDQRYEIEWQNLDTWMVHVSVATNDLWKLWQRVSELEAEQNRYLYKPLPRDLQHVAQGTILMLLNGPRSSTIGAPVLLLEHKAPCFTYLRVKLFDENVHFNAEARRKRGGLPPQFCLELSKTPKMGHGGTPVMLLEPSSPAMRQLSYVEVHPRLHEGKLSQCRTWCWPPVIVRQQSVGILRQYMSDLAVMSNSTGRGSQQGSQPFADPSAYVVHTSHHVCHGV
ncbi:hypothetical protein ACN47E_004774 [Coniothyrium glycines]